MFNGLMITLFSLLYTYVLAQRTKSQLQWLETLSNKFTGVSMNHCVPIVEWPIANENGGGVGGICMELGRGVEYEIESLKVEKVVGLLLGWRDGEGDEKRRL